VTRQSHYTRVCTRLKPHPARRRRPIHLIVRRLGSSLYLRIELPFATTVPFLSRTGVSGMAFARTLKQSHNSANPRRLSHPEGKTWQIDLMTAR